MVGHEIKKIKFTFMFWMMIINDDCLVAHISEKPYFEPENI